MSDFSIQDIVIAHEISIVVYSVNMAYGFINVISIKILLLNYAIELFMICDLKCVFEMFEKRDG